MKSLAGVARRFGVDVAGFRRNVFLMSRAAVFVRYRPSLLAFEEGKSLEEIVLSYLSRLSDEEKEKFIKELEE